MFEKIFGIFRKRKKADISEDISGDVGDELFDVGEAEFGDEFDADTISLETGMTDGGFTGSSGEGGSDQGFEGAGIISSEPSAEDEFGMGSFDEESATIAAEEEGMSPLPEVEPEAYAAPARKRGGKGILLIVAVVIIGLVAGFFLSTPPAVEQAKRIVSSEPTLLEQLETLTEENNNLDQQLKTYRTVGTIEEILAVKAELQKRNQMKAELETIEAKIADRPAVEERLDRVSERLRQTQRDLVIQKGALSNVAKALKQIEARNNYFVESTEKHIEDIETARAKSELLESRLEAERIQRAESNAFLSRDVQEGVERTAFEALSSL
jgi:hypothetical protein